MSSPPETAAPAARLEAPGGRWALWEVRRRERPRCPGDSPGDAPRVASSDPPWPCVLQSERGTRFGSRLRFIKTIHSLRGLATQMWLPGSTPSPRRPPSPQAHPPGAPLSLLPDPLPAPRAQGAAPWPGALLGAAGPGQGPVGRGSGHCPVSTPSEDGPAARGSPSPDVGAFLQPRRGFAAPANTTTTSAVSQARQFHPQLNRGPCP